MADPLVLLYRAADRVEAAWLAHVLESADVEAHVVGGNVGWIEALDTVRAEVWVRREDAAQARTVLEAELARRAAPGS